MKKSRILQFLLVLVLTLALGQAAIAADEVHWGYDGEHGPAHWGEVSPDYALCSNGKEQSPVDIPLAAPVNSPDIVFNYNPGTLTIGNNGHTIKVDYPKGSSITVEGKTYNLIQFHFHDPSEHNFAGQALPMEMHLVHQSEDGALAVVGVMIETGTADTDFAPIFSHMQATEHEPELIAAETVDANGLLPSDRSYYRYDGSLTTPPCTEGLKWFVLKTPIQLSSEQIAAYKSIFPNDARPVQPLNERIFFSNSSAGVGMPRTGSNSDYLFPFAALALMSVILVASGVALARRKG